MEPTPGDFKSFFDYLQTGGDAILLAIGWVVWRFHERLRVLELKKDKDNDAA